MPSLSQSAEHQKILEVKERLAQESRSLNNRGISKNDIHSDIKGFSPESFKDEYRLNAVDPSKKVRLYMAETVIGILTNTLTRGARKKVREMAGVNKILRWQALNLPGPDRRHPALSRPVKRSDLIG